MTDQPLPEPVPEPEPVTPLEGEIVTVRGRDAAEAERGLPRISEITLGIGGGQNLSLNIEDFDDADMATATGIAQIEWAKFDLCPICLNAEPDSREHVPPGAFGGVPMTWTCLPCNNRLGSRTESAMQDWFDRACRIRVTVNGVNQPLAKDRAFVRRDADGRVIFMFDKVQRDNRFADHMLPGAGGKVRLVHPRRAEYMTGLLKSAYLAACLHLRTVPDVASATEIRAELIAARDTSRRRDVALGPRADSLRAFRTGQPASGPQLALLRDIEAGRFLISLAGTVLVDWPFPEIAPA